MRASIRHALLELFGPPRVLAVFARDDLVRELRNTDVLVSFADSNETVDLYARASLDLVVVDGDAISAEEWRHLADAVRLEDVPNLFVEPARTERPVSSAGQRDAQARPDELARCYRASEVIERPLSGHTLELRLRALAELGRYRRTADIVELVAEAGASAVTIADATRPDLPFVWVNDAFERMTGYSRQEILGKNGRALQGRDTDPKTIAEIAEAIRAGTAVEVRVLNYRKSGDAFWNAMSIRPVRDAGGHLRYFVGVLTDITSQMTARPIIDASPPPRPARSTSTAEVDLAARRVERLAAMGTMVAGFAHEVRNPVSAMRSLIEILDEETPAPDPRRGTLARIERHLDRIERLVQSSLRFGRPDEPKMVKVAPERIIDEALEQVALRTGDLGVIRRIVDAPIPEVLVDEAQMSQAVVALLINAFEAVGYPDQIVLQLDTYASVSGDLWARVRVRDFGPGIPPHIVSRIFDPFFTTKAAGTGLGLSIAQRLVHDNGGRLEVSSSPGLGSTFTVLMPSAEGRST